MLYCWVTFGLMAVVMAGARVAMLAFVPLCHEARYNFGGTWRCRAMRCSWRQSAPGLWELIPQAQGKSWSRGSISLGIVEEITSAQNTPAWIWKVRLDEPNNIANSLREAMASVEDEVLRRRPRAGYEMPSGEECHHSVQPAQRLYLDHSNCHERLRNAIHTVGHWRMMRGTNAILDRLQDECWISMEMHQLIRLLLDRISAPLVPDDELVRHSVDMVVEHLYRIPAVSTEVA